MFLRALMCLLRSDKSGIACVGGRTYAVCNP
jgi:hypothetical protein